MYAVIRTGGKQYRVAPDDVIEIEKVPGAAGDVIEFSDVLMLGGDGAPRIGTPIVAGAKVAGEVLDQKRAPKIIVFKKKRRKNYRRKLGHRQDLTAVRITEILADGKTQAKAAEKPETAKPEAEKGEAKAEAQTPAAEAAETKPEAAQPADVKAEAKPETEKPASEKAEAKAEAAKPAAEEAEAKATDEAPAEKPAAAKRAAKTAPAKTDKDD